MVKLSGVARNMERVVFLWLLENVLIDDDFTVLGTLNHFLELRSP